METLIIFAVVVVLLIWQPIHPIMIGASIPIALSVLKVINPAQAFGQFANTTIIFFMSLLVVGGAIFKTGLADFLGEKIMSLTGKTERGVIMGAAFVTTALSAFLNDTGTTGCLIPIAGALGKKSGVSLSKIYLTLAFSASIGGTITLIGGGAHIVVQGFMEQAGQEGFGFFEYTPFGLPLAIVSFIWLYFVGYKILPVREVNENEIPPTAQKDPKKMALTAIIFVFVCVCMATKLLPMYVAAALGAFILVLTNCLTVDDALKSFSVSTMFLVAGVFALSNAMAKTGAAKYIVDGMAPFLTSFSPAVVCSAVLFLTIFATNFMMGTSLCAIFTPMALMIAQASNIPPKALAMAVALGASGAFCTPVGTGPNLLVWDIGGLKFTDYTKSGLPYEIFMWVIGSVMISYMYL